MGCLWICVMLFLWNVVKSSQDGLDENGVFSTFVDQYWDWRMEQSPEFATKSGSNLYADRWQSLTEDTFLKDKHRAEQFLAASKDIKADDQEEQDIIKFRVIQRTLKAYISGYKYRKYTQYNPITPMEYPSSDWKKIIKLMPTKTLADYDNLILRYRGVDTQVSETIALMREAIKLNTTTHSSAVNGFSNRMSSLMDDIDDKSSFFHQPIYRMPAHFTERQVSNITQTMTSAIVTIVVPAIMRFWNFVDREYRPKTRSIPGVYSLPDGLAMYQECLNWHLDVTMTPQEVHDMGLAEVRRIENNIELLMTEANFTGTMLEYLTYLKTLPENYYHTEAAMLDGYRQIINSTHKQLYKVLPDLGTDCPIIVEQNTNPQGWASYRSPSLDLSTPGRFVINVFNPDTRPTFGMTSLTLHETEPGHHTQSCYAIARAGTRKGRDIEFRKYYAVPFNFPFFTSFSEGWALYAESLGEEMGVYDTPNKLLGRYLNEIFRAVRLVVDTGIHAFGWSRQRAIDYIAKYTTRSMEDIENEVNRYISWPGQACAYKIGELKIREIRSKAEVKLGTLFDKRYFHNEILTLGAVPLSLLEEHMDKWVENRLHSESGSNLVIVCVPIIVCSIILSYFL